MCVHEGQRRVSVWVRCSLTLCLFSAGRLFRARLAACKPQGKLPITALFSAVITGTHETLPGLLCGLYGFELQSSYLCGMYYYSLAHLSRPDHKVIPYSALEPECFRCQNICTECIQYLFNFAIEPP